MDITITNETDDRIEFELAGTTPAFANALRRTMIENVPTLAIEDVYVTKNSTGLFDEVLAHRLGMVPWTFDPEKYEFDEEALEEDADDEDIRNAVHMALQKEGEGPVLASDIVVSDEDITAARPDTKVAELKEDGRIELEATARVGIGKIHAKWQAANAAYEYDEGDDVFNFTVESVSGLEPRTIVSIAVDRLEEQVDDFDDSLKAHL